MKLILLSLFFFISFSAFADGFIKYSKGKVIRDNKALSKGDKVSFGDKISVAEKSLAIIELTDGSKIKINEKSQIILKFEKVPTPELTLGSAFFKIIKKSKSNEDSFKVKARQVSLGVRGTEFFVSLGKLKQDVWMCVNEGLVSASSEHNTVSVKQGEGIHASNKHISNPKPLAWTRKLNWNMEGNELENKVSIEEAYTDVLGRDYD